MTRTLALITDAISQISSAAIELAGLLLGFGQVSCPALNTNSHQHLHMHSMRIQLLRTDA